jgi:hypothetical protein
VQREHIAAIAALAGLDAIDRKRSGTMGGITAEVVRSGAVAPWGRSAARGWTEAARGPMGADQRSLTK